MIVYLDNHSTTRVLDGISLEVVGCYTRRQRYGNPSSLHSLGLEALGLVETARNRVSNLLKSDSSQIYFTNSATEANNIVLKGKWQYERRHHNRELNIITTPIEHKSVLNTIENIFQLDPATKVHYVQVNKNGTLDLEDLETKLKLNNILAVSVMTANNEIGTINDIRTISKMCEKREVFFHTDATQAIGKVDINLEYIDALSFSSHKIHGPKGCGLLYLKENKNIDPIIHGGLQNTFISGTINVPCIYGASLACEVLAKEENNETNTEIKRLRDMLLGKIMAGLDDVFINGTVENRLINNINISIKDVPAEVMVSLSDVCISSGSACGSGSHEHSYVLDAIEAKYPENAIRLGLSRFNTEEEIEYAAKRIIEIAKAVRNE